MPEIVIANDDGIHSDGLAALVEALEPLGEIYVFAPDRDQSASGHALTLDRPLRVQQIAPRRYAVSGTPTDCVYLGIHGILKRKPQLVVGGINHGGNLADDITYSGTVACAMEGALMGVPSFAVSLVGKVDCDFRAAAAFARNLASMVLQRGLPYKSFLNVNVPNLPPEEVKPAVVTRQGKRVYGEEVIDRIDPRGKSYHWIGGDELEAESIPNSDIAAVKEGKISVCPIKMDLTDYPFMADLEAWDFTES